MFTVCVCRASLLDFCWLECLRMPCPSPLCCLTCWLLACGVLTASCGLLFASCLEREFREGIFSSLFSIFLSPHGGGVYVSNTSPCVRSKRPCVQAARAHVLYMWAWYRYTPGRFECTHVGFSACHGAHHTHHHHSHSHSHTHNNNQLAAQFASTRENSPGLDTVRIDRLFALS